MENIILVLHYTVCTFLIIVILLQAGKGADIGAAFGGASQTVFGSRGAATFLSKLTTVVAIIFLFTSISLASISKNASKSSVLKNARQESQPTKSPAATPAPSPKPTPSPKPAPAPTPQAKHSATPPAKDKTASPQTQPSK